VLSERVSINSL